MCASGSIGRRDGSSQGLHPDEYFYAVVPPERVVGVSESAYERRISNVYTYAERFRPIVAIDPERVLLAHPDLVLSPESARSDVPNLLRRAGLPLYRMYTMFETLASIEDHACPAARAASHRGDERREHGHIVVLESHVFLPPSPFTSMLVEALADALYGGGES
jgi:hypothetical protein